MTKIRTVRKASLALMMLVAPAKRAYGGNTTRQPAQCPLKSLSKNQAEREPC